MAELNPIKIESIQFKRGTRAKLMAWTEIPKVGEPIFESDTNKLKIGDGIRTYAELPYVAGGGGGSDQIIFDTHFNFPKIGEVNKLYIAKDECNSYIWDGAKYVLISVDGREIDAGGADAIYLN